MATGDSADILARLKSLVPGGWFARVAPLRTAVFGGIADALSAVFALLITVKAQTRIATAVGWFLDLIAWDFFGPTYLRNVGESDGAWRVRFIKEILRPRATRGALVEAISDLTGQQPKLIELFNPADCGGWDTDAFAYAGDPVPAPALSGWDDAPGGWDSPGLFAFVAPSAAIAPSGGAGCWGATMAPGDPFQVFITVYRPPGGGTPYVAGWDTCAGAYAGETVIVPALSGWDDAPGGWDVGGLFAFVTPVPLSSVVSDFGAIEWTSDEETGLITDDQIYAAIAKTVAAGVTAWVAIMDAQAPAMAPPPPAPLPSLQFDFSLQDNSGLLPLL